jgi:hypothetical protein
MERRRFRLLVTVLACLVTAAAAHAEVPCAADVAALCKDVPAGGGRIQACLKQNESKVSEACRKKIDGLASEVKLAAVVCRWDIGRLCSDVTPGQGKVLACLQQHEDDLSPECKKQLAEMKQ